jgi:hypothetical protein
LRRLPAKVQNWYVRFSSVVAFAALPCALFIACGGSEFTSAPIDAGDDVSSLDAALDVGADGCVPQTCAALHWACGLGDDGCGKKLDCGACHLQNFTCGGGGKDHECGCKPKTCLELGYSCGEADDGCGGKLNCGTCTTAGYTCGGGGADHHCGLGTCVKKTCQTAGAACGNPSDGCGATLDCGRCPTSNDVCTTAYQCQCVPSTCGQLGWMCGGGSDGCNGVLDCGSCGGTNTICSNHTCVSGGCVPQTSCSAKGYTCGVINNGCAMESCGMGPPTRQPNSDVLCAGSSGHPSYYACFCPMMPPMDAGPWFDAGTTCGEGAPNPPVPGWDCVVVAPTQNGDGTAFCCGQ